VIELLKTVCDRVEASETADLRHVWHDRYHCKRTV